MLKPYHFDYYHGWSYDQNFFKPLANVIEKAVGGQSQFYDRGYYAHLQSITLPPPNNISVKVAITHSLGLYFLCEQGALSLYDKIIIVGGFSNFLLGTPKRTLIQIKRGLDVIPIQTIKNFRGLCANINQDMPLLEAINVGRLKQDIDLLINNNIYDILCPIKEKIIQIHGDQDQISPFVTSHIPHKECELLTNEQHIFDMISYKNVFLTYIKGK